MRAAFQQHRQVGYVFAGSKPHLLRRMAEDPNAAFYRFGRRLELGPIPADAWFAYLKPRFGKGRIEVSRGSLRRIVELAEGVSTTSCESAASCGRADSEDGPSTSTK